MKTTKKTTVKKKTFQVLMIFGAIICVIASLIHSATDYIQPDLKNAKEVAKKAIALRKKSHSKMLENVLNYNDDKISIEQFNETNPKLIFDYRTNKKIASLKIQERQNLEQKYKINRFTGLQPFLYSFGNALTITFAGVLFFIISFSVSDYFSRMSIRFVSASFLSLGLFWISWALFQEGDYKDIGYYAMMAVVSILIVSAVSFLFRSFASSNDKIKILTGFIVRTRTKLFSSYDSSHQNAEIAKKEHDDDMYDAFEKTSK